MLLADMQRASEIPSDVIFNYFFIILGNLNNSSNFSINVFFKHVFNSHKFNLLFEANFIKDQDEREINKPLISPEIKDHLINIGDKVYLEAMLGGE